MSSHKKLTLGIAIIILAITATIAYFYTYGDSVHIPKDLPEIEHKGVLRIVTDYNSVGYFVVGDTIEGFNHDLLHSIIKYTDLKLEISVENDLQKSISELNEGKYDVLARNIPANYSLIDDVSFTLPIIRNKLVLVQHKPDKKDDHKPVRSLLDLAKATVYVPKASPAKLRLQNLSREIGDTIFVKEDSLYEASQLIMKVASREIEYAVCDAGIAANMAKSIPEIDVKTDIGFTHLESWAVRKNSPVLLDSLNIWIGRFQETKEFDRIYKKYYNK